MKRILFCLIGIMLVSSAAMADVLYLKNGKKIKGKILQESPSFKIDVGGLPFRYLPSEVEKVVKGDEPPEAAAVSQAEPAVVPEPISPTPAPVEQVPEKKEAAAPAAVSAEEVSASKEELIRRLLEVNGSREYMTRLFDEIINQVPEKDRALAQDVLKVEEIVKRLIPIYSRYYSEEELKEVITFYRSPTGAKHLQNTPKVMDDTMREVAKYFEEKAGPEKVNP